MPVVGRGRGVGWLVVQRGADDILRSELRLFLQGLFSVEFDLLLLELRQTAGGGLRTGCLHLAMADTGSEAYL